MKIASSRPALIVAFMFAATFLTTAVALPAAASPATVQDFTGYGISKVNAGGTALQLCILDGYLRAQCTLISDMRVSPGDDLFVAVVEGSN
jgi:hypothetical protein